MLMLGASIVLVTVSSIVAFSGWSPSESADEIRDLMLNDPPRPSDPQIAAAPALAAAQAVRAVAPAARAPRSGATAGRQATVGKAPSSRSPGPTPLRPDDSSPAPPRSYIALVSSSAAVPAPPPVPVPAPVVEVPDPRGLTDRLGRTTKDLTRGLGGAVEPINPQLGDTAAGTGEILGGTVESLDGVVEPLGVDPILDATGDALGGVFETLDGTGKAVGDTVRGLGDPY